MVEDKFIHQCSQVCWTHLALTSLQVGRVEDVVVDQAVRGKQLGKLLLATLAQLALARGCYKVALNCKDAMVAFYTGMGFSLEEGNGNFMVMRI